MGIDRKKGGSERRKEERQKRERETRGEGKMERYRKTSLSKETSNQIYR